MAKVKAAEYKLEGGPWGGSSLRLRGGGNTIPAKISGHEGFYKQVTSATTYPKRAGKSVWQECKQ